MDDLAFLFDNDGVLIDSTDFHWRSWELLMEEDSTLKMTHAQFILGFGMRNDLILQQVTPEASEGQRQAWAERKEALFRDCARGKIQLLEGMEGFLKQVKAAEIPCVIASSTPMANLEMYITSTVLGDYFSDYLSAEQVAHGKPAPDIFIAAAHHLGFDPKNCVVFEDSKAGLQSGRAAGAFVVALETTHIKEELSDYDLIYPSPGDLDLHEIVKAFNVWRDDHNT